MPQAALEGGRGYLPAVPAAEHFVRFESLTHCGVKSPAKQEHPIAVLNMALVCIAMATTQVCLYGVRPMQARNSPGGQQACMLASCTGVQQAGFTNCRSCDII